MIFEPVFRALNNAGARYLVVGGLAVVLHGHFRMTGDVDLIVHLEKENCRRAVQALLDLGFKPRSPVDPISFADSDTRQDWINTKGLTVFSFFGTSELPLEVDLFVREPFDFGELWGKRKEAMVGQTVVPVIDMESLIRLKEMSGRRQDLDDIDELRRLSGE